MSRTIDVSFTAAATVEHVGNAFGCEGYWRDRIAAFGGGIELDTFDRDARGTVTVTTTQDLRRDALPGHLGRLYPADLLIHRSERWTHTGDDQMVGDIDVRASGAPLSGSGTALLANEEEGSRLTFIGNVTFRVPIVGGKIEGYLAGLVREAVGGLHRFTAAWITEHPEHRSAT